MATSPAQIRAATLPVPALVPIEPLYAGNLDLAHPWWARTLLLAADAAILGATAVIGSAVGWEGAISTAAAVPLLFAVSGLYSSVPKHSAEELRRIAMSAGVALLVTGSVGLLPLFAGAVVALVTCRRILRASCSRLPWWGMSTIVLADSRQNGEQALDFLTRRPDLGLKPVGLLHSGSNHRHHEPTCPSADHWSLPPRSPSVTESVVRCWRLPVHAKTRRLWFARPDSSAT